MNKKIIVVTLFLVFIISLSVFVTLQPSNPAAEKVSSPFYVGVEFGYGGMSECKELIDKVCNYTNLLVISTSRITGNLTLLNETCDYAYQHGMNIIVYFPSTTYLQAGLTPFDWAKLASETYGSKFLGCYIYDEPGGEVLDHALDAVGIQQSGGKDPMILNVLDYHTAATNYVWNLNNSISHYLNASVSGENHFSVITADYGLFWFDYKAGFDTVLTEFGWGNNRELAIALCRGAATAQNKDWGAIICWEEATTGVGWLESGPAMYTDLKLAYDSGATYTVIFNYAGRNATAKQDYANPYPYGIMTDEHFEALQDFWTYIQQSPQRHGIIRADTAFVLHEW